MISTIENFENRSLMCNNYIITLNTTGSLNLLMGPKTPPHHGPHDRGLPSPGGGRPAPPRSGAASRRHATSILGIISQSSSWRLITLSQECVYSQQYCLSIFPSWKEIWSNIIGSVYIVCDVLSSNILPLLDISINQLLILINILNINNNNRY